MIGSVGIGALSGPLIAFIFGSLATNSIEGIALSKLINLVVLAPAVVVGAVPEPWQFVAGVLPWFWPFKAIITGVSGGQSWITYLIVGGVLQLLGIVVLMGFFVRRAD